MLTTCLQPSIERVGDFHGAVWMPTGLALSEGMPFEEWQQIGSTLKQMERSVMWWIGDWLLFGERKYGETYAQASDESGYEVITLQTAVWVAQSVESSRRREDLSWSHHREVASLPAEGQVRWLQEASASKLSTRQLRDEVSRWRLINGTAGAASPTCTLDDLSSLVASGEKFGTIYVDPPWKYGNQGTRAAADNHYVTMTVEEIAELPVRALAAENSHLHLWTTNAFLFECPRIIEAWGFEYKSLFVWVKPQMGIGNYWRVSHELLLFACRGKAPFMDRSLMSWKEEERTQHSRKPEAVRQMIERASPKPRLELFGRRPAEGWTVWGNEIERNLFHPGDKP